MAELSGVGIVRLYIHVRIEHFVFAVLVTRGRSICVVYLIILEHITSTMLIMAVSEHSFDSV